MAFVPFPVRLAVARVRAWFAHRRLIRRLCITAVVAACVTTVLSARTRVAEFEASWGERQEVVVITASLDVGEGLTSHVRHTVWPSAVIPIDAVMSDQLSDDAVSARPLEPGDVVTRRDVAGFAETSVLSEDQRALTFPITESTPTVVVGNLVDLVMLADPLSGQVESRSGPVAGQVTEVTDAAITVAVDKDVVVDLAQAERDHRLVVVRR